MTPADVAKELVYPLKDPVMLIAMASFGGGLWLSLVVMQLGPLFVIFGLLLGLLVSSTMFRYAIQVLDCRAQGLQTPVADIDAMTLFTNFWTFFPLVLAVAAAWIAIYLNGTGNQGAAVVFSLAFFILFPAMLAVLAITHSPFESIKPVALYQVMRRCGASYWWIPLVLAILIIVSGRMAMYNVPILLVVLLRTYAIFLTFTFTGAVINESGIASEVSIDSGHESTESQYVDDLTAERQNVVNHAYGFISRGNREGGFKHIRQWIKADPDPDDAVGWFLNEMMRWEEKDAALFFAQECLSHYLHHDNDALALKLMARCLHENPAWKPRAEDRPHAKALAEKYLRDDLLPSLRG